MEKERGGGCIGGAAQVVNETARVGCNLLRPMRTILHVVPVSCSRIGIIRQTFTCMQDPEEKHKMAVYKCWVLQSSPMTGRAKRMWGKILYVSGFEKFLLQHNTIWIGLD